MKTEPILIPLVTLALAINLLPPLSAFIEKSIGNRKRKKAKKKLEYETSLKNTIIKLKAEIAELEGKVEEQEGQLYDLELEVEERDYEIADLLAQVDELKEED